MNRKGSVISRVDDVLTSPVLCAELAKRACIFFASAFIGSMFSGYLVRFKESDHVIHHFHKLI